MSSVFRREGVEAIEVSDSWSLAEQLAEGTLWLDQSGNAELARDSILDIGFNSRLGERVSVQGESVPISFMQRLVALNVELWLSIYPPFADIAREKVCLILHRAFVEARNLAQNKNHQQLFDLADTFEVIPN